MLRLCCHLQLPQFEVSQVSQGQVGASGHNRIWGSALNAVLQTEEFEALVEGVAAQQRTDNLTIGISALRYHQLTIYSSSVVDDAIEPAIFSK